jgi:hypothetical protein
MTYHAAIRVYDEAGNVIETHEHAGGFQGVVIFFITTKFPCVLQKFLIEFGHLLSL